MQNIKHALLRMVRVARDMKELSDAFRKMGFNDGPMFDAYGNAMDAIYSLIGESVTEFESSLTYMCIVRDGLSDKECVEMLYDRFMKNTEQPKPVTTERDEMRDLFKKNGGYMTPEGDWT